MPAQLLSRLNRYLDQHVATDVMAIENVARVDVLGPVPPNNPAKPNEPAHNRSPHWHVRPFGDAMDHVQTVMIHETSGWPSYASANRFRDLFRSMDSVGWADHPPPGHWADRGRGVGTQFFVEPNGAVFTLIGEPNLAGAPRFTIHGNAANATSVGIENADIGDTGPTPGVGPRWMQLTTAAEDLTGRKAWMVLHPDYVGDAANAEDAVLVWIAHLPTYTDPGNLNHVARWQGMIFTERDYRSLALLCRLLAEQHELPRNFLLLPYLSKGGNTRNNAAFFRSTILAEQRRDAIATKLGTTTAAIQANNPAYVQWFNADPNTRWRGFFQFQNNPAARRACFRGFVSHDIDGGHPCPGPFFDWHRLAREVWDWWWWPFDLDAAGLPTAAQRPYRQARIDTPLVEYFWDAPATAEQYAARRMPQSITETFLLPVTTPTYAIANGVVVAARLAADTTPATLGFVLTRHEVFHRGVIGRIDYDLAPTYVWTLVYGLLNTGFAIPAAPPAAPVAMPAANPDWLKRFIIRLRETELAVALHTANPANLRLRRGWAHVPAGGGPRLPSGQQIERDAVAYRAIADDLSAGRVALFPLENADAPTPVRLCLGDFLGFPNVVPVVGSDAVTCKIFSLDELPVPGAVQRNVWDTDMDGVDWWPSVTAAGRAEGPGADLPADRRAWHYRVPEFLAWINGVTWTSEWPKYAVEGAGGGRRPAPPRPMSRRVI